MLCKHKHAFTLGIFTGAASSQEQIWWTESEQYQAVTPIGSRLPIPTLCVGTGWCHKQAIHGALANSLDYE